MALDDFKKDLEDNKRASGDRAERFKLKKGDNKVVILTNPIGFSQVFGIGIAYEGCGYAQYAGRKYKCYVLDLEDGKVKMADFSYTTAKSLSALSEGARTKFDTFPMPYVVNLKTENPGTKDIKTDVLADEDYIVTPDVQEQLEKFSPVQEVLENLKKWQKKQVDENPEMQDKIEAFLLKKEKEAQDREENKKKDAELGENSVPRGEGVDTIEYPEDDINPEDIPF